MFIQRSWLRDGSFKVGWIHFERIYEREQNTIIAKFLLIGFLNLFDLLRPTSYYTYHQV
jgi:hypothetical protein